ncbi:hypothetical protein E2562_033324 [Oryza meyeriana var. granulata]|uniref:Uncharacterized protein n=1 Tax=Oryza meyeriana var. granulata TaxID=110450 RepID=A0A6G1E7Z4_9ORYZ|nr:hypothetical protein E2562_033324 [Oryza meyeriana var. granulata]
MTATSGSIIRCAAASHPPLFSIKFPKAGAGGNITHVKSYGFCKAMTTAQDCTMAVDGNVSVELLFRPKYLGTFALGYAQKENINRALKKLCDV